GSGRRIRRFHARRSRNGCLARWCSPDEFLPGFRRTDRPAAAAAPAQSSGVRPATHRRGAASGPLRLPMSDPKLKTPREARGAPFDRTDGLRSLGFDHLGLTIADRDLARLLRLGDLAHEIDVQESVLEGGAFDLDVVGKLEDALERARRDALIEHLTVVLLVLRLVLSFGSSRPSTASRL